MSGHRPRGRPKDTKKTITNALPTRRDCYIAISALFSVGLLASWANARDGYARLMFTFMVRHIMMFRFHEPEPRDQQSRPHITAAAPHNFTETKEPRAKQYHVPATPCHVLIDNRCRRWHLQPISQTNQKCRRSHFRIFFSSRRNVGSQKGRPRRNCKDAFVPFHVSSGLLQQQQQQQHQSRTEVLRPQRRRWRMTPVGGGSGSPSLSHGTSAKNNDNENPLPPPATTTETARACTN